MEAKIENIIIGCISPSPMNPRKTFNEEALRELSESIIKQGLLQPITVRHQTYKDEAGVSHIVQNAYEVICGERRYRACKMISKTMYVPCIVHDMTDDEAFDAMITENLQRRDVDPIEEAVAFKLLQERGQSTDELATRFGKSVRYINDRIRLGSLLEPISRAVSNGQIPLRGAYLLARLSEEDQKAWLDDEWDEDADGDISTYDVEQWLDRHFRNLWRAPFQDGSTLNEDWNPYGKLIRRCKDCECNTCNQGCLFADMNTEEPQCINDTCYERKIDVYNDWTIQKDASLILCGKESPCAGRVALVGDESNLYNEDAKERFRRMKERCESQGYRVFTDKELPTRVWSNGEEEFKAGRAIRIIDMNEMARGWNSRCEYRRIPGTPSANSTASNYPSQLAERSAAIGLRATKKILNYAKKNFDKEKYIGRTAPLEEWEKDIIAAIVFHKLSYDDMQKLIKTTSPSYQQIHDFRKQQAEYGDPDRWMRLAIVNFINSSCHETYYIEAVSQQDPLAQPFIQKTRKDAEKRIQDINDELRELGYDEHANKIE